MAKRRIRDPVHDLIEFSGSELESTLWRVMETRPFQRLRRVKQLGFSDLVYPGATHSRFAHSVGVFHTARQLMQVVRRHVQQDSKEHRALAAALVHDLGHGPFSHAFEKVGSRLGLKFANHESMSDALIRDGEVAAVLNELGSGFASDVADIVQKGGTKSVQHAVVSSQFDADRLDYIRRDRMMTGSQHAAMDFTWLIANLEIAPVPVGTDETQVGTVETFVLGPKAIYAAEAFVLGLFQLYPTVFFHKATRGAEKIFAELLVRVVELVRDSSTPATGLDSHHPLIRFAISPEDLDTALGLDDAVIWGALAQMCDAPDPVVSKFAVRLRDRKLHKCIDIRTEVAHVLDPNGTHADEDISRIDRCCASIGAKLGESDYCNSSDGSRVLLDDEKRSPYRSIGESAGPLDRINVRTASNDLVDLKERSAVVAALKTFKLFRAYVDRTDTEAHDAVCRITNEEIERCHTQMQ